MSKTVLGFDISSETIGYCILEIDEQLGTTKYIDMNYLKPSKNGSLMERIVDTRDKILDIVKKIKPDYIGIEDLIKFMPKSTATTVVVLTTFNRMICLLSYDYLGHHPELFNVMTIRHGLKLNKILPKKEEIPNLVAKHLGITFPYIYKTSKKKGKTVAPVSEDMADGVAVALYYAFVLTGKVKKKNPKAKKSNVKS